MRQGTMMGVAALATMLAGCASAAVREEYRDRTAQPVTVEGRRVVAFAFVRNPAMQRVAEEVLVRELRAEGASDALAAHQLWPGGLPDDSASIAARLRETGADGVVSMRAVSRDVRETASGPVYSANPSGDFWGWWRTELVAPRTDVRGTTRVETSLWSLRQGKLLWRGVTDARDGASDAATVRTVAERVGRTLRADGILR